MTPNLDDYVDVAERIRQFYEKYPDGALISGEPWMMSTGGESGSRYYVCIQAKAYRTPDDPLPGVGSAWEPVPGPTPFTKDSEMMNAETAAWGRAIVALGFETKKVASRQEVEARSEQPKREEGMISPKQHARLGALLGELQKRSPREGEQGTWVDDVRDYMKSLYGKHSRKQLTQGEAAAVIEEVENWLNMIDVPFGEVPPDGASVA